MRTFMKWFGLFAPVSIVCTVSAFCGAYAGDSVPGSAKAIPFHEVNSRRSSPVFQSYVDQALKYLKDHPTKIGRLTYESIQSGFVRVDEMSDLTSWDFWRVRRSLMRWGVELNNDDYFKLHRPQSGIARKIESVIDAYMWGNRIYVSRGFSERELATALVHEVNHILNGAERDYYDRWPVNAFLHEYRAFYAEKLFEPSSCGNVDLVRHIIMIYRYDRSSIPESVLKQPLTGLLFPTEDAWRLRSVESDPVDDRWLSPVYG
jgi:hypothetical protein